SKRSINMLCAKGTRARVLRGTIFAAGILLAPNAFARPASINNDGSAWRHERVYGERISHRARMSRASDLRHARHTTLEMRNEDLYADERERPITAELNLVQLRVGRERAAEIAQRQLRHGAAASLHG